MFPGARPNVYLLKKQQADSLRLELQTEKDRATQEALAAKREQHDSLLKIRDLEQQLEEEKAAKLQKKAASRRDHNATHLRRVRRLQEIGRLILDEQQEMNQPRRVASSLDDAASLLPRHLLISQDTRDSSSLQESCSQLTNQVVGGTPKRPAKHARAVVSERMKAYSRRVQQQFRPERNEQKQLQLDMIREQKVTHKPPRPARVKLSELI